MLPCQASDLQQKPGALGCTALGTEEPGGMTTVWNNLEGKMMIRNQATLFRLALVCLLLGALAVPALAQDDLDQADIEKR